MINSSMDLRLKLFPSQKLTNRLFPLNLPKISSQMSSRKVNPRHLNVMFWGCPPHLSPGSRMRLILITHQSLSLQRSTVPAALRSVRHSVTTALAILAALLTLVARLHPLPDSLLYVRKMTACDLLLPYHSLFSQIVVIHFYTWL